ncbi:Reverse transcriptase-like [Sesbania bispinosa]|nr:Reverse transcriptase-like [Sesbania bispinosa]
MAVLIRANSLHRECARINQVNPVQGVISPPRNYSRIWKPPGHGITKLNIDATYNRKTGRGTIACLARNTTGNIEFGRTGSIVAPSVPMVEAFALRAAISLARNLGQTKIVLGCDSRDLVLACWHKEE